VLDNNYCMLMFNVSINLDSRHRVSGWDDPVRARRAAVASGAAGLVRESASS
jgi:hypothetical protein